MSLGLRESRNRRRRRVWVVGGKWLFALAVIAAAAAYSYYAASRLAAHDVETLQQDIEQLSGTNETLVAENDSLKAELAAANRRANEWQGRYEREVPKGEVKQLTDLVVEKVGAGVAIDRLAFLIDAAGSAGACDNQPTTKRFIVPTPLYKGANSSVGFADGAVTVTALGASAVNESGQTEAWFDPAQPVTLVFTLLGGKTSEVTGKLPLHSSVLVGESEYRFTAVAGDRGFINVTADRCKFP